MPEYLAPGVYVEETSFRPKSIEGVSTSTTGFVGPTRRGPIGGTPELITSFNDFERMFGGVEDLIFGGVATTNYLANSVRAYFNEGGARLYVARVFTKTDEGRASWSDASGLRFFARTPGECGRGSLTLRPKLAPAGKATLERAPAGTLLRVGTAAPAKPATLLGGVPPFAINDGGTLNLKVNSTDLVATFRGQNAEITSANPLPDPVNLTPATRSLQITIDGVTRTATLPDGAIARTDLVIALNAAMRGGYAKLSPTGQLVLGSDRQGKLSSIGVTANAAFGFNSDVAPVSPPAGAANNVNDLTRVTAEEVDARLQAAVQAAGANAPGVSALIDAATGRLALVTRDTGETATLSVSGAAATSAHETLGLTPLAVGAQPAKGVNGAAQTHYVKTDDKTWADPGNAAKTLSLQDANALSGGAATLTLDIEAADQSGSISSFEDLGLDPRHPRWMGAILAEMPKRRREALENVFAVSVPSSLNASSLFALLFPSGVDRRITLTGGNDGVAPSSEDYRNALATLEKVEDISIVAAPGHSAYPTSADDVRQALLTHVDIRTRYRIAVLDSKPGQVLSEIREDRGKIDSTHAALYYPWVVVSNPLSRPGTDNIAPEIALPPSGFLCGIYARSDAQTGVWKAPANEVVFSALRFETEINFNEQGSVNPLGINCLRSLSGRGNRVWGARTATSDPEWKYVNVRRYFNYLERSIDVGTQWAVFMPNGERLWANVTETVESFLYNEWSSGALLGTTTKEAYFVRCDRSTMTQNDLDNGRLICLVGVAVLKPAEFVIFRVGQKLADSRS